jgi:hypothetical protein
MVGFPCSKGGFMGRKDALTYNYMNDNSRFADIMNFYLYAGKQVIRPESLRSLDSRMTVLPFGRNFRSIPVQKYRGIPEEKRPLLAAELTKTAKA